ncbi:MAG: hypothetical protein ACSHX0_12870 [Akkermansiaceae bacterium]
MISNSKESLYRLSKKYPAAKIAMEVGIHSLWISRYLKSLEHHVIVANARKLRAIYQSHRQSASANGSPNPCFNLPPNNHQPLLTQTLQK